MTNKFAELVIVGVELKAVSILALNLGRRPIAAARTAREAGRQRVCDPNDDRRRPRESEHLPLRLVRALSHF